MTILTNLSHYKRNRASGAYSLRTKLDGHSLEIAVDAEKAEIMDTVQSRLEKSIRWVIADESVARQACADFLLDVKNQAWLDKGQKPIDAEAFKKALTLAIVHIKADGSSQLRFRAGRLFWGHEVVLEVDPDLNPYDADIEG